MIQSFISWAWWCNQFLARAHYTTVHLYTARQIRCVQYNGVYSVQCGQYCAVLPPVSAQSPQSRSLLQSSELQTWFKAVHQQQSAARAQVPWDGGVRSPVIHWAHQARAGSANWNIRQHYPVVFTLSLCIKVIPVFYWLTTLPDSVVSPWLMFDNVGCLPDSTFAWSQLSSGVAVRAGARCLGWLRWTQAGTERVKLSEDRAAVIHSSQQWSSE